MVDREARPVARLTTVFARKQVNSIESQFGTSARVVASGEPELSTTALHCGATLLVNVEYFRREFQPITDSLARSNHELDC